MQLRSLQDWEGARKGIHNLGGHAGEPSSHRAETQELRGVASRAASDRTCSATIATWLCDGSNRSMSTRFCSASCRKRLKISKLPIIDPLCCNRSLCSPIMIRSRHSRQRMAFSAKRRDLSSNRLKRPIGVLHISRLVSSLTHWQVSVKQNMDFTAREVALVRLGQQNAFT